MRSAARVGLVTILALSTACSDAPASTADLDAVLRAAIAAEAPVANAGTGVAVIEGGELSFARGYGLRDREQGLPFDENTLFAIGSTTKAFTALSLVLLAADGAIDLETPVRSYLPAFGVADPVVAEQATAVDLLAHRSGLAKHDGLWYFRALERREYLVRLPFLEDDTTQAFRQSFVYHNLMYMTAGILVEQASGQTWEDFVAQRIFIPLGMSSSNGDPDLLFASPNHALGYHQARPIPYYVSARGIAPAGAINSNLVDLARWVGMYLRGGLTGDGARLVTPDGLATMLAPANHLADGLDYGLGWAVSTFGLTRLVWHSGHLDGYAALVSFIPEVDLGVVVLINENQSKFIHRLAGVVYERLLSSRLPPATTSDITAFLASMTTPLPPPDTREEISLAGATRLGLFSHPGYGEIVLYQMPEAQSWALDYYGNVWPATSAGGSSYEARVWMAGYTQRLPFGIVWEAARPVRLSLPLSLSADPQALSHFERIGD